MGEAKRRAEAAKAANDFAKVYRHWPEVPLTFNPDTDRGGVFIVSFAHDEWCPGLGTVLGASAIQLCGVSGFRQSND